MKATEAMFAWNDESDQVQVGQWPLRGYDWTIGYRKTGGACYRFMHELDYSGRKAWLFIEAFHLIARDKVDPDAVHREFCKIDEFRDGLAEDFQKPRIERITCLKKQK